MFIDVYVDIGYGNLECKKVEIDDETLVKMIDRYFELKGIEIKEIGII